MEVPEIQNQIALEKRNNFIEKDSSLAFDQCVSQLKKGH